MPRTGNMAVDQPTIIRIDLYPNYTVHAIFSDGAERWLDIKTLFADPRRGQQLTAIREDLNLFLNPTHSGPYGVVWTDDADLSEFELYRKGVSHKAAFQGKVI